MTTIRSTPETVQYTDVYRTCTCAPSAVAKYQKRISGPLPDCINLRIEVPRLSEEELLQTRAPELAAPDDKGIVPESRRMQDDY